MKINLLLESLAGDEDGGGKFWN